jgi:diguanylate cyclase (GGDEF)-like protein
MAIVAKRNQIERPDNDLGSASEEKFLASLDELEADFKKIEDEVGEERCAEVPRCLEAKLSVELYRSEHDNAGAFKFKRFERQMIEAFERSTSPDRDRAILPEELAKRRYIVVNMGELDRINKEGHSQDAGDVALAATIRAIDDVCLEQLGPERAAAKNVFRYGGNEYCVELDGASDEEIKIITAALANASLDMKGYSGIEPPPLSVVSVELGEQFEIMMDSASALMIDPDNPTDLAIETVEALRRAVDYNLELAKFVTRVGRAVEKIKAGPGAGGGAEAFFNNYLRKSLQGTALETLEAIKEECDKPGFREVVELMAVNEARSRFADDRKFAELEGYLVNVRLLAISKELEARGVARPHEIIDQDKKIATVPRFTKGLAVLDRAKKKSKAAVGTKWEKAERLAYAIEAAKRDRGTGLMERGQFYGDWVEQVQVAQDDGESAAVVFIDMGFLKYFNDAGGRPVGDAALRQAAELMEAALEASGIKGEPYRYGGDEFAVRVKGGRDEAKKFVVALNKLRRAAGRIPDMAGLRAQRRAGDPEVVGDSRLDYAPTELVFNAGIAELTDFHLILNDLRESGELNKILTARNISESEFRAELMVKLADAAVGYEKAVERFETLLDLMKAPAYQDGDSPYHARVESIIRYSQKAILGGLGGDAALRVFAESGLPQEDVKIQIERFVSDRLERTTKIVEEEKALADKLIELHAVRNRLIKEVERLIAKDGEDQARVRELRIRLDEAEKARADLIAAKSQIKATAIDKKARVV